MKKKKNKTKPEKRLSKIGEYIIISKVKWKKSQTRIYWVTNPATQEH